MSNSSPTQKPDTAPENSKTRQVSTGRALFGSVMSAGFAIALYFLTASIAQSFASKPVTSTNDIVVRISVAVRTLVVGVATLGTGIFAVVALGLLLLSIQLLVQSLKKNQNN